MKLKHCPKCNQDLPKTSFTSTQAKYCNLCKQIVRLEQQKETQNRAFSRLQKKKQKSVTRVSLADEKKRVRRLVHKYIKLRDASEPCISCQTMTSNKPWEAGHFIAQGSSGALRFNLLNIHKQCYQCNRHKSGNLLEYRIHLVKKIGVENVEWLEEHRRDVKKWTRDELAQIVEEVNGLLEKLNEAT